MKEIKGLGQDLIEVERIQKSIERHGQHFLDRIFTKKEQEYCKNFKNPNERFAGRFTAKEAVAKALGLGFGKDLSWHDLEILNDESGRPVVSLSKQANEKFDSPTILLSISHTHSYATSVAICLR